MHIVLHENAIDVSFQIDWQTLLEELQGHEPEKCEESHPQGDQSKLDHVSDKGVMEPIGIGVVIGLLTDNVKHDAQLPREYTRYRTWNDRKQQT